MVSRVRDIPMVWGSANLSGIHLARPLLGGNWHAVCYGIPDYGTRAGEVYHTEASTNRAVPRYTYMGMS